ncbi:protein-L-isoaspartate(D-aspartate) O-methyltransferase [Candidatus Bipolaricaulota bacterium]|nr:protein-L-isoaspartate(D-aspartate) O-methyltransferase [Candidatus Bipolaricaulota bacterium]
MASRRSASWFGREIANGHSRSFATTSKSRAPSDAAFTLLIAKGQDVFRESKTSKRFDAERARMVEYDLRRRGIHDLKVLEAMSRIPRHDFVPPHLAHAAYEDCPLPIGSGQTISQPYIVALMTQALHLKGGERVLELGTGSGYQTAVLAEVGAEVWTIERLAEHAEAAKQRLQEFGNAQVHFQIGDGTLGWPSAAPFDRILSTGGLPSVPDALIAQLCEGGLFVGPIGPLAAQQLMRIVYHARGAHSENLGGCRFVPMIGEFGWRDDPYR